MADNHKENWATLVAAAEQYRCQTGNEVVLLTAFKAPPPGGFGYAHHGSGALADAVQHYLEDIAVVHKTTAFTYAAHPIVAPRPSPNHGTYSRSYPSTCATEEPAPHRTPALQGPLPQVSGGQEPGDEEDEGDRNSLTEVEQPGGREHPSDTTGESNSDVVVGPTDEYMVGVKWKLDCMLIRLFIHLLYF